MPQYDELFFDYVNQSAIASAKKLLPVLAERLKIRSVLDVGCGEGGWLHIWNALGAETIVGLDGEYVQQNRLLIPADCFQAMDLSKPFSLSRRFDLVQSLEVGEHLPETSADDFVASLVAHAPMVLFSAATVGQGGDHHINEQPLSYWRDKFAHHDFVPVDAVRPDVVRFKEIDAWYRYNTLLYVHKDSVQHLPPEIQARRIPSDQPLPDFCPALYRFRKKLISWLPIGCATSLAKLKEKITLMVWALRKKRNPGDA